MKKREVFSVGLGFIKLIGLLSLVVGEAECRAYSHKVNSRRPSHHNFKSRRPEMAKVLLQLC